MVLFFKEVQSLEIMQTQNVSKVTSKKEQSAHDVWAPAPSYCNVCAMYT